MLRFLCNCTSGQFIQEDDLLSDRPVEDVANDLACTAIQRHLLIKEFKLMRPESDMAGGMSDPVHITPHHGTCCTTNDTTRHDQRHAHDPTRR
jgi:hypothetical protein